MKVRQIFYTGMILFVLFLICVLISTLSAKEPQGRLIKPFPKDTVTDCGWCRAVKTYSLNVNVHHYGDSLN